jgi:nicotinic acid mononucleotide adenylyltransferase
MVREVVDQINESPFKAYFAIAGGGQTFIGDYCKISGASKTVIGAIIPYSQAVFNAFLKGATVDSYASSDAARKLAVASYNECLKAGVPREYALGIGAANSIVKDEERAGRVHRFHIALHGYNVTKVSEMLLQQGRTREHEESIASYLIYRMLAQHTLQIPLHVPPNEGFTEDVENADNHYVDLVDDKVTITTQLLEEADGTYGIYCGSWNPVHEGHLQIREMAAKILKKPVVMELSVNNSDKGQMDFIEIRNRIKNLGPMGFVLTGSRLYVDKVRAIKRSWGADKKLIFVMGADTWNRMWDEKYGFSRSELRDFFLAHGVKFLVFGREGIQILDTNRDLRVPSEEAANFNSSFSSSAIRKAMNAQV